MGVTQEMHLSEFRSFSWNSTVLMRVSTVLHQFTSLHVAMFLKSMDFNISIFKIIGIFQGSGFTLCN